MGLRVTFALVPLEFSTEMSCAVGVYILFHKKGDLLTGKPLLAPDSREAVDVAPGPSLFQQLSPHTG